MSVAIYSSNLVYSRHHLYPMVRAGQRYLGRFAVTGQEHDRFVFRVPSLRNIALTAPYFHDGSAATLGAAVNVMARKQLGRTLEGAEVDLVVGFLQTLTGEYGGRPLYPPAAEDEP